MKTLRRTFVNVIVALAFSVSAGKASDLSAEDKTFLDRYEKVRAALAADDLSTAKTAAGELGEQGAAVAKSDTIKAARSEFTKLSERAIELGRGKEGYYVANCPMLKKDWLQTSTKISNPYAGKSMLECGVIRK
ncbi:hypothetical protein BH18VER1_BH18VER1_05140 [soil metagenome]